MVLIRFPFVLVTLVSMLACAQMQATPAARPTTPMRLAALSGTVVTTAHPAFSAFTVSDSVGINAHLQRSEEASHYAQINALLATLGLKHIRDSFAVPMNATSFTPELVTLHRQVGIDFMLTTALGQERTLWSQYANAMAGGLDAIEGVNEPNIGDASWDPTQTRALQQEIWNATHGGPPSLVGVKAVNASVLGCAGNATFGDQSSISDYANSHQYWLGFFPGSDGWGPSTCGGAGRYGSIVYNADVVRQSSRRPIYTSETGYCTANIHGCVPQAIAAVYEPEILLDMFLHGIVGERTFLYELLGRDWTTKYGTLGIVNPDLTPKPEFYALAGLLERLKDTPGSANASIGYAMSGAVASLTSIPLRYADGGRGLLLFQNLAIWDPNGTATAQGSPIAVPVADVSVALEGKLQSVTLSTYDAGGTWTDGPRSVYRPVAVPVGNTMMLLRWRLLP